MPGIERLYVSAPYCMPAASGMQHDAPTLSHAGWQRFTVAAEVSAGARVRAAAISSV